MSKSIQAIYENGMLRPLQPLNLGEQELVWVSVERLVEGEAPKPESEIARQQDAIRDLLERMERRSVRAPKDDFSNRDHDQVLYPKTP